MFDADKLMQLSEEDMRGLVDLPQEIDAGSSTDDTILSRPDSDMIQDMGSTSGPVAQSAVASQDQTNTIAPDMLPASDSLVFDQTKLEQIPHEDAESGQIPDNGALSSLGVKSDNLDGSAPQISEEEIQQYGLQPSYAILANVMLRHASEYGLDAVQMKRVLDLAHKTGFSEEFVHRNFDELRRKDEEIQRKKDLEQAPGTAKWVATNTVNATAAKDDIGTLAKTEQQVNAVKAIQNGTVISSIPDDHENQRKFSKYVRDLFTLGTVSYRFGEAQSAYHSKLWEFFERQSSGASKEELDVLRKECSELSATLSSLSKEVGKVYGWDEQFVHNSLSQATIQISLMAARTKGSIVGGVLAPSIVAAAGLAGAPVTGGATLPLAGAALTGIKFGGASSSMTEAYNMEVESAFPEMVQQGVSIPTARMFSRIYGVLASIVEFGDALLDFRLMGVGTLAQPGQAVAKMTIKKALLDAAKVFAISKGTESIEEAIQQGIQTASTEAAKLLEGIESKETMSHTLSQMWDAAWSTLWSIWGGGMNATIRGGVGLYQATKQNGGLAYQRDQQLLAGQAHEQSVLNAITDESQRSQLAQTDPVLYQEVVEAMHNGSDMSVVYVPAQGLLEAVGGDAAIAEGTDGGARFDAMLNLIGVTRDDFSQTLMSGGDLVIPLDQYAAAVAQDREFATLIQHDRRLTPDGYTTREFRNAVNHNRNNIEQEIRDAAAGIQHNEQVFQESRAIMEDITTRLVQAGRTQDEARNQALQMASVFTTLAERGGVTPKVLWEAYAPQISRGENGEILQPADLNHEDIDVETLVFGTPDDNVQAQSETTVPNTDIEQQSDNTTTEFEETQSENAAQGTQTDTNLTPQNDVPANHNEGDEDSAQPTQPENQASQADQRTQRVRGNPVTVSTSQGGDAAHYEVRELSDVIPSHDPESSFVRRTEYPEGVQERPYHSDRAEQQKVMAHALQFNPAYLINDNPDATNGAPIITESGVVLGGNSRAMTLQHVYATLPQKAALYRTHLKEKAAQFGIAPEQIDTFANPVLVRVVDDQLTSKEMAIRSRLYNETPTQGLDVNAEGVSRSRMISDASLSIMAEGMEQYDTVREYLSAPASKRLVQSLIDDGVLEVTQLNRVVSGNMLTDDGKRLVVKAIRGLIVANTDVLNNTPASVLNKLDRAIVSLVALKKRGGPWDMSNVVTEALRLVGRAADAGTTVTAQLGQGVLIPGMNDPRSASPAIQAVAITFENATQREISVRFAQMAQDAENVRQDNRLLAARENTPATSFIASFLKPIAAVDGKPIANFNLVSNPRHQAIAFAYQHGGRGHSVIQAINFIADKMKDKTTSEDERAILNEHIRYLADLDGTVALYEPKLGAFFTYRPGRELFQLAWHGTPHEKYYQTATLFSDSKTPLGSFIPSQGSERSLITLFEKADESTFLHESGHLYLEMLRAMANSQNATPEIRAMWDEAKSILNARCGEGAVTDAEITTEAHETWASSLEDYFMKGKAPSLELQSVFAKFAAWLKRIYMSFRQLGKTPDPELDHLFQRMFATDEQIAEVEQWHQRKNDFASIADQQSAEMLRASRQAAHDDAAARRMKRLTQAYLAARGGRAKIAQDARLEVLETPVYAAMEEASQTGISYSAVVDFVGQEQANILRKKRVGILKKDGVDPAILAAKYGFSSPEAMLTAMLNAERMSNAVRARTQEKIQAITDQIAQGVSEREALPGDAEYHGEAQLAVLVAEHQILIGQQKRAQQKVNAKLEAKAMIDAARDAIVKMPSKKALSPYGFSVAERRAAQRAWKYAMQGKWEQAAAEKHREAIAHAMFVASYEFRERVSKQLDRVKDIAGSKSLTLQVREMIVDLGIRFGILHFGKGSTADQYSRWRQRVLRDQREFPDLVQWEREHQDHGYAVAVPQWIKEVMTKRYQDLSLEELSDVLETIAQIRAVDRLEQTGIVNQRRIEIRKLAQDLDQAAEKNGVSVIPEDRYLEDKQNTNMLRVAKAKFRQFGRVLHAAHAKIEAVMLNLDGWKEHGIWWTTFFQPIARAENEQLRMLHDVSDHLKSLTGMLWGNIREQYLFFNKRIQVIIPSKTEPIPMTMNQIISVALNMGNAGNISRLLTGNEDWKTQADLNAIVSHLDKQHWDFCQAVWDYFETFRPAAFALEREMAGRSPKAVEAQEVVTRFGTYRGGYYPIVYDPRLRKSSITDAEGQNVANMGQGSGHAMTRHGHLQDRSRTGTGDKILIDLSALTTALYDTVHDLAFRRAIVEISKLLRNPAIVSVIKRRIGNEGFDQLEPWLRDIARARPDPQNQSYLDGLFRWARHGITVMQMGLKITTMVVQPLGYTQTINFLGRKYAAIGFSEFFLNPTRIPEKINFVYDKSEFMRNRVHTFDRDIRDASSGMSMKNSYQRAVRRFAMSAIGYIQLMVDMPTWLGAYRKGLSETGGNEIEAIERADQAVRITQASGAIQDLALVQRGSEAYQLFTIFYSFFNTLYQLAWRAKRLTHSVRDVPQLAGSALALWFVPVLLGELIAGRGPDTDGDEDWGEWMIRVLAVYPAQMIVGVRDIVNASLGWYGYKATPAEGAPQALVSFCRQVSKILQEDEDVEPKDVVFSGLRAFGFATHLPLGQPIITLRNIWDALTGDTPDFLLRDLFFVRQKSRQ